MFGSNNNNIKLSPDNWTVNGATEKPTDTVSSISWSKTSTVPTFATGSWDSHVRIYEVHAQTISIVRTACLETGSPCLSVDWHQDGKQVFAGCASGDIKVLDLATSNGIDIGGHAGPVKDVHWVADLNVLCSVSFDKTVKLWDLRQSGPVYQFETRYKPMYSDVHGSKLALALSEYQVTIVDLAESLRTQSSQESLRYLDSPLGNRDPLSAIQFLSDGERLAVATVGGRCNISRVERGDPQATRLANIMTFKAHKTEQSGSRPAFMSPVSSILVNSKKPTVFLGTCGGEGKIVYWDFSSKNKAAEFQMRDSVTCGKMSHDGNWLAFATGYDWSRGISEYMSKGSEVCVRPIHEKELSYR